MLSSAPLRHRPLTREQLRQALLAGAAGLAVVLAVHRAAGAVTAPLLEVARRAHPLPEAPNEPRGRSRLLRLLPTPAPWESDHHHRLLLDLDEADSGELRAAVRPYEPAIRELVDRSRSWPTRLRLRDASVEAVVGLARTLGMRSELERRAGDPRRAFEMVAAGLLLADAHLPAREAPALGPILGCLAQRTALLAYRRLRRETAPSPAMLVRIRRVAAARAPLAQQLLALEGEHRHALAALEQQREHRRTGGALARWALRPWMDLEEAALLRASQRLRAQAQAYAVAAITARPEGPPRFDPGLGRLHPIASILLQNDLAECFLASAEAEQEIQDLLVELD